MRKNSLLNTRKPRPGPEAGVLFSCLLVALFALLLSHSSLAQKEQLNGDDDDGGKPAGTLAFHVDEVDLSFVLTDSHHRWITDLTADEIKLRDNGQPPESIRIFQSQTGLPLRIAMVVDTSGSVLKQFQFERDAAALFISQSVEPRKDLAFVVGFTDAPYLVQDYSGNTEALADAIEGLRLGGATAVYDAIYYASRKLLQRQETELTRRVLVLLTDGMDNSSRLRPEEVMQDALRSNVVVIVMLTDPNPDKNDRGYRALEKLAIETGGQILPAGNKKQMAKSFSQLSAQLRSYYLLAYRPAQFLRDGSYRKIQLKTTRHGVHVICRKGYYAARGSQ
jgi:VWFA-related protein